MAEWGEVVGVVEGPGSVGVLVVIASGFGFGSEDLVGDGEGAAERVVGF